MNKKIDANMFLTVIEMSNLMHFTLEITLICNCFITRVQVLDEKCLTKKETCSIVLEF